MLLTVKQAAKKLGLGESTVHLWITKGYFPGAQKLGRDWLIPEDEIEAVTPPKRGRPFDTKKEKDHKKPRP